MNSNDRQVIDRDSSGPDFTGGDDREGEGSATGHDPYGMDCDLDCDDPPCEDGRRHSSEEERVRRFLSGYAWLGSPEDRAAAVDCIMAQDGWRYIAERADQYAGAQFEPGPEAYDRGEEFALSALYECHDGPHQATCPFGKRERNEA